MTRKRHLHIGTAIMEEIEVLSKRCVFPNPANSPDEKIGAAFKRLREVVSGFGFDPDSLLHIGIPVMDGQALLTYDCCIEFPFPMDEPSSEIHLTTLPGGPYIILRMEKKAAGNRQILTAVHRRLYSRKRDHPRSRSPDP